MSIIKVKAKAKTPTKGKPAQKQAVLAQPVVEETETSAEVEVIDDGKTMSAPEIAEIIDQLGQAWAVYSEAKSQAYKLTKTIIEPFNLKFKHLQTLLPSVEGVTPEEVLEQRGKDWEIVFGPAGNERAIITDAQKALVHRLNEVQPDLGYKLVKMNMGDIDMYLSKFEQNTFVETKKVARPIKEVRKRRATSTQ